MLEQMRDGLLGFFLVMAQWMSPGTQRADIRVTSAEKAHDGIHLHCVIDLAWNDHLGELVDAGIPLRFLLSAVTDAGPTPSFVRTLRFDVAENVYYFADTSAGPGREAPRLSKRYPQVLLAVRDLVKWSVKIPAAARTCRIEAEILPSEASRLGRMVDMSNIWGQRKVTRTVVMGAGIVPESGGNTP